MKNLIDIPVHIVTRLTPEQATVVTREILRAECGYAKLSPTALTISSRLTTADGGIDAEIDVPLHKTIPEDCIFQVGFTGFQIKSGASFRPWSRNAINTELLNRKGELNSEVARLVQRGGRYVLICTGHDLTPQQRNNSRQGIAEILAEQGFDGYENLIEVFGAGQLAEFAGRYSGTASLLNVDPTQEALVLADWSRDSHMANLFQDSPEQSEIIAKIRALLQSETKHIRVLGEAGLGKTRIILEALRDESIAPYVLYIPNGSMFGQTALFNQLLKSGYERPLILVLDDLPESELSDIWRHLKLRCGSLKIVSLDHGRDETYDEEIERLTAPCLTDETIKKILASRIGESHELDRWAKICEGSPRVAQAVAENLSANPSDLLKPPSTVPIWRRFLHGHSSHEESLARQIDCTSYHLALFSRFGYEVPVDDEAAYIFDLIREADPTIGRARFQEIIQALRDRRVLQGSRTLFFVPKALHIHLWTKYWEFYGHGFDIAKTFSEMPVSLHVWFMNMFKYAGNSATSSVIDQILRPDGIFSQRTMLTSDKGSRFLSILAEAKPSSVLTLLEFTVGKWQDQEVLNFSEHRQNIVWALEKIAVWPDLAVRALRILARLAVHENAKNSNNATGTLVALFQIGPEWAATESTPKARLRAMLELLRSPCDAERRLGLKAMNAALGTRGMGFRTVGPEYQGLKERAKLWMPSTYGEWWEAKHCYFQTLIEETAGWPASLRSEVCQSLLEAVEQLITIPQCTELAFEVLNVLTEDHEMPAKELNTFFWNWQEHQNRGEYLEIAKRLKVIELRNTRKDTASRFQRYVVDIDLMEWDENIRERHDKPKNRSKILVNALAARIANRPEKISEIQHLLSPEGNAPALWHFGEQLAVNDIERKLMPTLIEISSETRHQVCLHGYLSEVYRSDPKLYLFIVRDLLKTEGKEWLGATIVLRSDYEDSLFTLCLDALENGKIESNLFGVIRFGRSIESVPQERATRLFHHLYELGSQEALVLLVELLDAMSFNSSCSISPEFVFNVVSKLVPGELGRDVMHGYYWKNVCLELVEWDNGYSLPLLDSILTKMRTTYRLSYDSDVAPLANELVLSDPLSAWNVVRRHLEDELPQWRTDLLNWLKGEIFTLREEKPIGIMANLPVSEIIAWIDSDSESRAVLIAHAVPATLDDRGGELTRELLSLYGQIEGVRNGISATFHSGGWTGPTSDYLKGKRNKLRRWLASDFDSQVIQWVEAEIAYLDRNIERAEIDEERSCFD